MSDDKLENLKIYYLKEFREHGIPSRVVLVKFFLDQIFENLKTYTFSEEKERPLDLTNNQKLSLLQLGASSHLMILIEDMATMFTAFKQNDWDYYKYLDNKEKDLGQVIGHFYNNIDSLKDEEIRNILGYANPSDLDITESDRDFLRSIIKRNIDTMRYFLHKIQRFWTSHIKIFRRYKHAGFPIMLGQKIPSDDPYFGKKFSSVSIAITSKENMADEVTLMPFSRKALESYKTILDEISVMFYFILERNSIKLERKLSGIIPTPRDNFSKRFTKKEIKRLDKTYKIFMEKHKLDQTSLHIQTMPQGLYPVWYTHLDILSESYIDLAEKKIKM